VDNEIGDNAVSGIGAGLCALPKMGRERPSYGFENDDCDCHSHENGNPGIVVIGWILDQVGNDRQAPEATGLDASRLGKKRKRQ